MNLNLKSTIKTGMILVSLSFLWYCQSKPEILDPVQNLYVTVYDHNGQKKPNVKVALFDNADVFKSQKKIFGTSGALRIGFTNSKGEIPFDSLSTEVNYYLLAYEIDDTTYAAEGYNIHHDNTRTGYELVHKLNKSSNTYASVSLLPAEALVSFYANTANSEVIPVVVFVNGDSIGKITQTSTNGTLNPASNPIQNGVITSKVRIDDEVAYVRFVNDLTCNSIGKLDFIAGGYSAVDVNKCDAGVVGFWTADDNKTLLPISISLNGKTDILDTTLRTAPKTFKTAGVIRSLEPGDYTYSASSKDKDCSWQGTFTITKNGVAIIPLERCEPGK